VLFVADIHGNEKSATYTNQAWLNYLDANAESLPANRTVVVIPSANPDGFAANTRRNAHNVDLNRNFPAYDWTPRVLEPGNLWLAFGGGTKPLSEPESQSLAVYIQATHPQLVLTYHAVGGIVLANGAGNSPALAQKYAKLSNLSVLAGSQSQSFFGYDATGALEGWTYDKLGIATLVLELHTEDGNEFSQNEAAMWAMATQ
jgi:hypothetical protein